MTAKLASQTSWRSTSSQRYCCKYTAKLASHLANPIFHSQTTFVCLLQFSSALSLMQMKVTKQGIPGSVARRRILAFYTFRAAIWSSWRIFLGVLNMRFGAFLVSEGPFRGWIMHLRIQYK